MSEDNKKAATSLESLQAENAALSKENDSLKKELKDAQEIVKDLKNQVKASKGGKSNTIKIGGSTYQVVGGFRSKDKTYTAEDIASNEKIAKELLEKSSGLIKKLK
jgi:regulator of replication initiation timing